MKSTNINLDGAAENNISINKDELAKRCSWTKFAVSYFHHVLKFKSRNSSEKASITYCHLYFFARYLESRKVLIPNNYDIIDYIVIHNGTKRLDYLEIGVSVLCKFVEYCQDHQGELFNGLFKGLFIQRKIVLEPREMIAKDIVLVTKDKYGTGYQTYVGKSEDFIND